MQCCAVALSSHRAICDHHLSTLLTIARMDFWHDASTAVHTDHTTACAPEPLPKVGLVARSSKKILHSFVAACENPTFVGTSTMTQLGFRPRNNEAASFLFLVVAPATFEINNVN